MDIPYNSAGHIVRKGIEGKKRNYWLVGASAILALSLTAWGNENEESSSSKDQTKREQSNSNKEARTNNESKT